MAIFKVIVREMLPCLSEYLTDIPSDEYVESMVIGKVQKNQASQVSTDVDITKERTIESVVFYAPVNIKTVRAEGRAARELLKIQKSEKAKERKEETKADRKMTLKEKK